MRKHSLEVPCSGPALRATVQTTRTSRAANAEDRFEATPDSISTELHYHLILHTFGNIL
jgi:hypothetical protein